MWFADYEVPTPGLNQLEHRLADLQSQLELLLAELADAERRQEHTHPAPLCSYLQQAHGALSSCATALNQIYDHRDYERTRSGEEADVVGPAAGGNDEIYFTTSH
jgi:hypothetical protein